MRFVQKLLSLGVALSLSPAIVMAQQPSLDKDDNTNHSFKAPNGMHVVIMRDAAISFTTEPADSLDDGDVLVSGPIHYSNGIPVGGYKNYNEKGKDLVAPSSAGGNFAVNNWVFCKNGYIGAFAAEPYDPSMDIDDMPGAVVQTGLMTLNDGKVVANTASTNRNKRVGIYTLNDPNNPYSGRSVAVIFCQNCTAAEQGLFAKTLGATDGGILTSDAEAGIVINADDIVQKSGDITGKLNLVIDSDVNHWKFH